MTLMTVQDTFFLMLNKTKNLFLASCPYKCFNREKTVHILRLHGNTLK